MKKFIIGTIRLTRAKVILRDSLSFLIVLGLIARWKLDVSFVIGIFVITLIFAYAFAVNDIEDADDDAKDPKKKSRNPVSSGYLSNSYAINILRFLAFLSFIASILSAGIYPMIVALSAIFISHLYSWKVVRLKGKYVLDFISHSYFLATAEILYFILLPSSQITLGSFLLLIGVSYISFGGSFYNQFRDYVVDREVNLRNSSSLFTQATVYKISLVFYILGIVICALGIFEKLLFNLHNLTT